MSEQSRRIAALLEDNALETAIEQVKSALKSSPSDNDLRHLYIDLLILSGQYERADQQCDLAAKFQPADAIGFSILRHQIRAMSARKTWFEAGAVPDFPNCPTDRDQLALKFGLAVRENAFGQAVDLLEQLEESRSPSPMEWNGNLCADLRDLDDRIPHALEVLTTGGAYLWVDFRKIDTVTTQPLQRPRDLAFRQAELTLIGGAEASVLLPAVYYGNANNPAWQLGRETEWQDLAPGLVVGCGQRCFLAGDEITSLHELTELCAEKGHQQGQMAHG
jgi:type VI secretion system protein ImpE